MARKTMLCLAVTALVSGGCGDEAPPPEKVLRPVRSHTVARPSASESAAFVGVAKAGIESRLSMRVSGTVDAVNVKVGDRVGRGRVLVRLDPTDYELKVEEAEAALAQAVAGSRRSQADYDRTRALYENNNSSKSELDAARADSESSEAQVEAANKQLEQAQQQLGYTHLRAPLDGAIAEVSVEINENVQAGQDLFLLTSGARPEVAVGVPESFISRVTSGQLVSVQFDAFDGRRFGGEVSEVGVSAVEGATYEVTVRLRESSSEIRSGMAADVLFEFSTERGEAVVQVPLVAVGEDGEGRFVYVIEAAGDGTGVARRRRVEIGEMSQGGLEVISGLAVGEVVATAGVRRLSDGLEVKVLADSGGAG